MGAIVFIPRLLAKSWNSAAEFIRLSFVGAAITHEHSVLHWEILNYPWDFWTDEISPKLVFRIGVGICETCKIPVMQYKESEQPWPERYEHCNPKTAIIQQRVAP